MDLLFLALCIAIFVIVAAATIGAPPVSRYRLAARLGVVGVVLGGDSTTPASGRQGKTGESIISQVHGKYYESASRGTVFNACDQAAGVATVTAISTTSIFSLYNPQNSGKKLVINKVRLGYFSGTLGAGPIYHCINTMAGGSAVAAPTSGTLLTAYPTDAGVQSGAAAVGIARTGSTVTSPIVHSPICSVGAALASTATFQNNCSDDLDGEIVIEPGNCYQIQSKCAAGSSPLITVGVSWEEIPIAASNG